MTQNTASDMPAADWLCQTLGKYNRNFSRVEIQFFSAVEIPIKHSSSCNKVELLMFHLYSLSLSDVIQMTFIMLYRGTSY